MFCGSCGGPLAASAGFCPACGQATAAAGATAPPPPTAYEPPPDGQWPGSGPVEPGDKPSYWPTVLISFFLGVFGLIPAIRHSKMAARRGYKESGYWVAFGSSFGASLLLGVALPIVLLVSLAAAAGHAHQYSALSSTGAAAATNSADTSAGSGPASTYDSYDTTPSTVPATTSTVPATTSTVPATTSTVPATTSTVPTISNGSQPGPSGKLYPTTQSVEFTSGPGNSGQEFAVLAAGTMVGVQCKQLGEPVGPYSQYGTPGEDPYWDEINIGGQVGFVADEWVATHSDELDDSLIPPC